MTSVPSHSVAVDQRPEPASETTYPATRATITIGTHFLVDVFSFVGVSLMPLLAVTLGMGTEQKALLLALGSLCSGVVQPIVAWVSDKFDTRAVGTLGFVVAVLCIGSFGLAQNFVQLAILYSVGAAGIGAFHPPAAAITGHLGGSKRSKYVAFFFLAGMVGGMTGNVLIPEYVAMLTPRIDGVPDTSAGLRSLLYLIPIGLVAAFVLAKATHGVAHRHNGAHATHTEWDAHERRQRWFAVGVLYVTNMLRFSVNMALVYLLIEWVSEHTLIKHDALVMTERLSVEASKLNGILQASMQVGMGGMGIVLGLILSAKHEKLAFIVFPMLGSIALFMIPRTHMIMAGSEVPVAIIATILTGVGFGAVIPVSISLAQRLLPHRTSLASGLMLGGAWMIAFLGPIVAELIHKGLANKPSAPSWLLDAAASLPDAIGEPLLEGMGLTSGFTFVAAVLFLAGLIAMLLPGTLVRRVARH
jgi:MFS family permease